MKFFCLVVTMTMVIFACRHSSSSQGSASKSQFFASSEEKAVVVKVINRDDEGGFNFLARNLDLFFADSSGLKRIDLSSPSLSHREIDLPFADKLFRIVLGDYKDNNLLVMASFYTAGGGGDGGGFDEDIGSGGSNDGTGSGGFDDDLGSDGGESDDVGSGGGGGFMLSAEPRSFGKTFTGLVNVGTGGAEDYDQKLESCFGTACDPFTLADQGKIANGGIFVNSGGSPNLLFTRDKGESWRTVLGAMQNHLCYNQSFLFTENSLLVSGECPLDKAYVRKYSIESEARNPRLVAEIDAEFLSNRKVTLLQQPVEGGPIFAGCEGCLLKSDDQGATWDFVVKFPLGGTKYPYLRNPIAVDSTDPLNMLISGTGQTEDSATVMFTSNGGDSWQDVTSFFRNDTTYFGSFFDSSSRRFIVAVGKKASNFKKVEFLAIPVSTLIAATSDR